MMSEGDVRKLLDRVKARIVEEPHGYFQSDPDECIGGKIRQELGYVGYLYKSLDEIHEVVFGVRKWPWLFNSSFDSAPGDIDDRWNDYTSAEGRAAIAVEAIDVYFNEWVQERAEEGDKYGTRDEE